MARGTFKRPHRENSLSFRSSKLRANHIELYAVFPLTMIPPLLLPFTTAFSMFKRSLHGTVHTNIHILSHMKHRIAPPLPPYPLDPPD
ncbi:hypothetical protein IE53DRAFT_174807 [Violaceomyces palustris]|uniref:Uncharacterized protein n=1 Tax=Violaceomyces palustris TaxID=1673888 RepID=A0ACD0NSR9_9BASI|nr:hypothetical protein IE53DRAFT_174807 [Violaceomyces palustris]